MNDMSSENQLDFYPKNLLKNALDYSPAAGMVSFFSGSEASQIQIEYVNGAFTEFLHTDSSEIIGKNPFHIFKTSADNQQLDVFYKALIAGKSIKPEIYLELPSGDTVWIRFMVISYFENGKSYQLWMQQDLSSKKKQEISFEQQKEHLSRLFDDSEELIFCLDAYGQSVYINNAFCRHTGKNELYWSNNSILSVLHCPEDEEVENSFRGAMQGVQQSLLTSIKGRNNHALWYNFTLTPILSHGKVNAVYYVGREATMIQLKQRYELQISNLIELFQTEQDLKTVLNSMLQTLSAKFGW